MAQGSHFYFKKINRILISTLRISILSSDHKKIIKDHKLTPSIANRAFACDRKFYMNLKKILSQNSLCYNYIKW